jgi:RNase H-fold protein (predicted Holliday junction resolvase)
VSGLVAIDPGRSKCGLALCDAAGQELLAAGVLPARACLERIQAWSAEQRCHTVLLGDGTGSAPWRQRLAPLPLTLTLVPEAGTTLAARRRYWQLEPPRGWRRLLPEGLRLPPRDIDDVVAQLLLERHLQRPLQRDHCEWLSAAAAAP